MWRGKNNFTMDIVSIDQNLNEKFDMRVFVLRKLSTTPDCFFFFLASLAAHSFKSMTVTDSVSITAGDTRFCELCQCIIRFSGMQLELIL